MRTALLWLLTALVSMSGVRAQNALPPYIKVCKRNDPNIEKCILNSIENLRPKLKSGIPELDVPGLDPLLLNELNVTPGQGSRTQRFKAVGHHVKAHGIGDFKIHKIEANLEKNTYRASIEIPVIRFEGEYEVNVNFLALPIKAKGPMSGNTTDAYGEAELFGHIVTRNGQRYLKFDKMNVDIALSNYHIFLGNLFGDDSALSQSVNQAINANAKDLVKVIKPIVDATATKILLSAADRITEHFTYDQLFPAN